MKPPRLHLKRALCLMAALALAGCSDSGLPQDPGAGPTGTPAATPAPSPTPPEGDDDAFSVLPAGTESYVFIANPANDNVARVKIAPPVEIDIIEVGDRPEELHVAPDGSFFVAFNSGGRSLSKQPIPTGVQWRFPVRDGVNHTELSPLGTHAFAFYVDALAEGTEQPTSDTTLVDLTVDPTVDPTGAVIDLFLGLQPRQVGFAPDDSQAFVLANDRITAIDLLSAGKPLTPIPLGLPSNLAAKEMVLSANADSALVLAEGLATLKQVDLIGMTTADVTVGPGGGGTTPTDLDVTPDGAFFVVANLGTAGTSQIDLIDTTTSARTEIPITGALGSVVISPDSQTLYGFTRTLLEETLHQVDISNPGAPVVTAFPLVKPVRSVFVTPNNASLIILHRFEDVLDGDPVGEGAFANDDVITLVTVDPVFPSFYAQTLPEEPLQVSVTPDGGFAYFIMEQSATAATANLNTLLLDEIPLTATPLFVGSILSDHTAYVLQKHPLGRISFVRQSPPGFTVQTITGFELNAQN